MCIEGPLEKIFRNFWDLLEPHNLNINRLHFTENPKLEKQDTFTEKLVTQVIKNLQVKISNIHVRYEDHVSIQAELP